MPVINLNPQLSINYIDPNPTGNRTVLLLHGLGANCTSWGLQLPALIETGYRPIAADARGFGKSSYPNDGTSVKKMASDMVGLMELLQVHAVYVVGISMGGAVGLQLTLDNPSLVNKLVLINTFAGLRPKGLESWGYLMLRVIMVHTMGLPRQANTVVRRVFPHPEQEELRQIFYSQIIQANPRAYRATMRSLINFNVTSYLKHITVPTLIVTGENDNTVPPITQNILVKEIQQARQVIIKDAGHAVVVEQPQQFNKTMIEFFTE